MGCALIWSFLNGQDPVGVTLGGTAGHALCTTLAVIGGNIIAQRISVRSGMDAVMSYFPFPVHYSFCLQLSPPLSSYHNWGSGLPHFCLHCTVP